MAAFPLFVSAGEALTDMIVRTHRLLTSKLAQRGRRLDLERGARDGKLGVPSAFAGAISRDVFGDALWQASEAAKLDLRFLQRWTNRRCWRSCTALDPPATSSSATTAPTCTSMRPAAGRLARALQVGALRRHQPGAAPLAASWWRWPSSSSWTACASATTRITGC
jgi:hypothetical protein